VFRRIFWLAMGLGAGATGVIMASRWMDRQKQRLSPANVGRQASAAVGGLASALRDAASEYRKASAEREAQITAQLGET
jgi:hypothetical protein